MPFELKQAERKRSYFRGALIGISNSGKTYTALRLAFGLSPNKRVALVDTESGRGELYAELNGADGIERYMSGQIVEPFTSEKYIEALDACVKSGIEVVIFDSVSHLWEGKGGILEQKNKIEARSGNKWTSWAEPKRAYENFLYAMLSAPVHVIVTSRAKREFAQEYDEEKRKTVIRHVGMGAKMAPDLEYEMTVAWEVGEDHIATAIKDTTTNPKLFEGKDRILTEVDGKLIYEWYMKGEEEKPETATPEQIAKLREASKKAGEEEIPGYPQGYPEVLSYSEYVKEGNRIKAIRIQQAKQGEK